MFLKVRFQICCCLWGSTEVGPVNLEIPYCSLFPLVAFVLSHDVVAKIIRNVDVRIHVKLELQEIAC